MTMPTGAQTRPLDGVVVTLADEHLATVAAGEWLERLGATVHPAAQPPVAGGSTTTPIAVGIDLGPEHPLGVSITQPPDVDPDDAVTLWARSAMATLGHRFSRDGEPPCFPTSPIPQQLTGIFTALLVCSAELARRGGRHLRFELDQVEVLALLPMLPFALAQLPTTEAQGNGAVGGKIGGRLRALDGDVYLRAVEPAQWDRLLREVPGASWVADELRDGPDVLDTRADEIDELLRTWVATVPLGELVEKGRALRVPVAPYSEPSRLGSDEQHVARGFADGTHAGLRLPWICTSATPSGGGRPDIQDATGDDARPLGGVRILDLTWAWAGPFATTLLAELGADVLNVEWHPRPSNLRVQQPLVAGHGVDGSGWWSANQRGKRSIVLDLKHPLGHEAVIDLASHAHAVIENFTPGVVDRLGIGFTDLLEANGGVVYVSLSAYGGTGPRREELGYGPHLYATAGLASVIRTTAGDEEELVFPIADPISGLVGALALVASLLQQDPVHLDVSELEATTLMHGWSTLAQPGQGTGEADEPARFASVRAAHTDEALRDEYLNGREFWGEDRTPALAGQGVKIARAPWLIGGRRPPAPTGAPPLGADTRRALQEVAGWSDERIEQLLAAGAGIQRTR